MKSFLYAIVLIAAVTLYTEFLRDSSSAYAQVGPGLSGDSNLIVHTSTANTGGQQMVVIDPVLRVMAVYHVDSTSGKVSLKSVRNIKWDLLIEEFNGGEPSPRDIRTLLN